MKMGFRWYGDDNDQVLLNDIRQIPGVETVVWSLHHKQAGDEWTQKEIDAEVRRITAIAPEDAARGITRRLDAEVVESVNVHESIKLGRDILAHHLGCVPPSAGARFAPARRVRRPVRALARPLDGFGGGVGVCGPGNAKRTQTRVCAGNEVPNSALGNQSVRMDAERQTDLGRVRKGPQVRVIGRVTAWVGALG
ncbi:mannonate dehydratase [Kribbella sp. CA-245084]|uniref:mannonate dehydratase n=1 Tax=Kribbella sp. CA-245084 TaxID=3239940 RepID=UPI003D93BE68